MISLILETFLVGYTCYYIGKQINGEGRFK